MAALAHCKRAKATVTQRRQAAVPCQSAVMAAAPSIIKANPGCLGFLKRFYTIFLT